MRRTTACGILAAILVTLFVAFDVASAAERIPGDRLLPPDVYLFVEIPSVPEFKERWSKTLAGQLGSEAALADFWKDVEAQVDKLGQKVQESVGVSLNDMLAIPTGQLTIAVARETSGEVGVVVIIDYGDNKATVEKLLATANAKLREHGAKAGIAVFGETSIVVQEMPEPSQPSEGEDRAPKATSKETLAWFMRDNRFVIASDEAIAESVLTRWDGKHSNTFADSETLKYIRSRCRTSHEEPAIHWYVDPVGLFKAVVESAPTQSEDSQMALNLLPQLGLTELKAIGGSIDMNAGEFNTVSKTVVYVDGDTRGILNVLKFPETELSPPKWVSSAVTSYVTYNWDVVGAYTAIEEVVDGISGPGMLATFVDEMARQPGGPGIHLKRDFIEHLSGRVHKVGAPAKVQPTQGAAPGERVLLAFDTKNAERMKATCASIAKAPGFQGKAREFSGVTLYELTPKEGTIVDASSFSTMAVVDNSLMIASDVGMLEQVIRGSDDQQPLSETPDYRRVAAHFPVKTSAIEFAKQDAQIEMVYEMLRKGTMPLPIPEIDFSKLPPFAEIKKYLPPTGSFAMPDSHGAYYETFSLSDSGK